KKLVNKAASRFLVDSERLLASFEDNEVAAVAAILADPTADLLREDAWRVDLVPPTLRNRRPRAALRPPPADSRELRRFQRRRRRRYFYRRQSPQTIPTRELLQQSHDRLVCDAVAGAVQQFRRDAHELLLEVGRTLTHAEWRAIAELSRTALEDP